jgi:hypothetical protein
LYLRAGSEREARPSLDRLLAAPRPGRLLGELALEPAEDLAE